MPVRIIIGLLVTVIGFGIAARRFHWLSRLIRSGKKDPNRTRGPISRKAEAETVEVAGQRKLLQWTVPGLAHFFTMWGFTILLLTIIEAYGDLFDKYFHIPGIGTWDWVGFVEDFFTCAVLVALIVFSIIRAEERSEPPRAQVTLLRLPHRRRLARPRHDRRRHDHAAPLPGRAGEHRPDPVPLRRGAPSPRTPWPSCCTPLGAGTNSVLATVFLILNIAIISGFIVFISYSKHLHIFIAPINVAFSRRPRALGALYSTPDMDMENVDEDTVFGVGEVGHFTWKQMLDFATCTECGRCQSACPAWNTEKPLSPEAAHHGPARQHVRLGHARSSAGRASRRRSSPTSSTPTCCGPARPAAPAWRSARSTSSTSTPSSTCGATRCSWSPSSPPRPASCCATSRTRATPGASGRTSAPSGPRASTSRSRSSPAPSPTTSSTSTGSAAPARSTSGPARACRPRPACCTGPASPSASSGPRSPAPATRCAAWATSTSTRSRRR